MDQLHLIVREEGRAAKNCVAFSVPVGDGPIPANFGYKKSDWRGSKLGKMTVDKNIISDVSPVTRELHASVNTKSRKLNVTGGLRVRSASAGRDGRECNRARHWSYLFDNLKRAVDEIYQTCEKDESIIECREAIMILENYNREFHGLIDWFKLKIQISENGNKSHKPIAWEIRKTTPSKLHSSKDQILNGSSVASSPTIESTDSGVKLKRNFAVDEFQKDYSSVCQKKILQDGNDLEATNAYSNRGHSYNNDKTGTKSPSKLSKEIINKDLNDQLKCDNSSDLNDPCDVKNEVQLLKCYEVGGNELSLNGTEDHEVSNHHSKVTDGIQMNDASTNVNLEDPLSADSLELQSLSGVVLCPSKSCLDGLSEISKNVTQMIKHSSGDSEASSCIAKDIHHQSNPQLKLPYSEVSKKSGLNCVGVNSNVVGVNNLSRKQVFFPKKKSPLGNQTSKLGNVFETNKNSGNKFLSSNTKDVRSWQRSRTFCGVSSDTHGNDKLRMSTKSSSSAGSVLKPRFNRYKDPQVHNSMGNLDLKNSNQSNFKPEEDEDGWKTVRSRTRSRYPPGLNHSHTNLSCLSAGGNGISYKGGKSYQRYDIPSGAKSLPALALLDKEEPKHQGTAGSKIKSKIGHQKPLYLNNRIDEAKIKKLEYTEKGLTNYRRSCIKKPSTGGIGSEDASMSDSESLADEEEMKRHELALESVEQQEHNLQKEIMETEDTKIEIDTETSENEAEESDVDHKNGVVSPYISSLDCSRLELGDDEFGRQPGRALHLHEKLSSPFRKRTLDETFKRHQEKQAKAQVLREQMKREKFKKLQELSKKITEVRATKEQILSERKTTIERKQKRAEEKRQRHLREIVRKAHDEEEKAKEIAFINELEAQNKRHDIMDLHQSAEARLAEREEERQQKQEARAAKEAAAEERRRLLEEERKARVAELVAKSKKRFEEHEKQLRSKKQEQIEAAREKQRDREERRSAREAADAANKEELQKKIQQKQEESARRHEENIEQIRQRAFELSILRGSSASDDPPHLVPYETKKICTLCNILIGSEVYLLSHLKGKRHQLAVKDLHSGEDPTTEDLDRYNIKHIVDAPADKIDPLVVLDKERQKALKKKCKKLKQRMTTRGNDCENLIAKKEPPNVQSPKVSRILREVVKIKSSQGIGPWPPNAVMSIDRAFGDLSRLFEKSNQSFNDKTFFRTQKGFQLLSSLLDSDLNTKPDFPSILPAKCLSLCCNTYRLVCEKHRENASFIVASNHICSLIDVLAHRLSILLPENGGRLWRGSPTSASCLPVDCVVSALLNLLATILETFTDDAPPTDGLKLMSDDNFWNRLQDIISYIVSVGIVDKLTIYFNSVHGPIDDEPQVVEFLLNSLAFFTSAIKLIATKYSYTGQKRPEDPTQLLATLQVTELAGVMSMLYGMLIRQGLPFRGGSPTPPLVGGTLNITRAVIQLLHYVAYVDLPILQMVLGSEGISLEFRHITSYLLRYCSQGNDTSLLHDVIRVVGYFTVGNPDNQLMVQLGQTPTVLQQLCSLPFPYFSNPELTNILFPTLLSCCYMNKENRKILEQEMSFQLLEDFLGSASSQSIHLVKVLLSRGKVDK